MPKQEKLDLAHVFVISVLSFAILSLVYAYYNFLKMYKETKYYVVNTYPKIRKFMVNRRTRPDGGPYKHIGNLVEKNPSNSTRPLILPLYGKPTYAGSRLWNYHTFTEQRNSVKVPVIKKDRDCDAEYGCEQMYEEETVYVSGFQETEFTYKKYAPQKLRYIPYIA